MWFKRKQKEAGITADDIAKKIGRAASGVSHIYAGERKMSIEWAEAFAEALDVPLSEILQRAGSIDATKARNLNRGFSEGDAVPWGGTESELRAIKTTAETLGGGKPGIDVWVVNSRAMILGGILPGDHILVDTHQSERCRAGDMVVAQVYDNKTGNAKTVIRRYEPPVLIAASTDPNDQKPLVVDGNNVVIKGKITAVWRNPDDAK